MDNGSLMTSKRFAPLFWTQFLSAINDNFLKNALVFLILFSVAEGGAASQITLCAVIFITPFLFLSALGGEIADKFDKALIARRLKCAEIGAASLAVAGMAMSSIPILMAALFLFGVIAAMFGPIKYGILPDHLHRRELPRANAWIEGATFAAIMLGTVAGGLIAPGAPGVLIFGPLMLALAMGCWLISQHIPQTGATAPALAIDANILRST